METANYYTENEEGKLHSKDDGPAVIIKRRGTYRHEWWNNGQLHRVGKPAIVHDQGWYGTYQAWYFEGQLHRTDGPATVEPSEWGDRVAWYINGTQMTKEEYCAAGYGEEDFLVKGCK